MTIEQKWECLTALLQAMRRAVLAYSGGVDSSLLLAAAAESMGSGIIAVTAVSETYPASELASAGEFARSRNARLEVISTGELEIDAYARNTPERCYYCKKELFAKLRAVAEAEGIAFLIEGSNTDDLKDHRPGRKAALEFGVRSPLIEADLSKDEIRELARRRHLPLWDKPSLACLSSRIPYGTRITAEVLRTVQAAEDCLHVLGFRQVRVRHQGDTARVEVDASDFARIVNNGTAGRIVSGLRELGYIYVCLDLAGYRTGSMNEVLHDERAHR